MSARHRFVLAAALAAPALLVGAGSAGAAAESCAAITADAARLACYDEQARRNALVETPAAPPAAESPAAAPAGTAMPAPASAVTGAATTPPVKPASWKDATPSTVESTLIGPFEGWTPTTRFPLQNGQVWRAAGDDAAYYPNVPANAAVTIRRNLAGAYWMEVDGVDRRVQVRRIQ